MMVYDKEIVEQAGVELPEQLTIEELYDIGQTIYEKTGVKTYYDGGINMMRSSQEPRDLICSMNWQQEPRLQAKPTSLM